jgi:cell pole-organizing protein PopZ
MSQPIKGQEPSMEEILASIRRIISDDDAGALAANGADDSIDAVFDETPMPVRPGAPQEPAPDRTPLSPRNTVGVDTAFNSPAHTMLMQNPRTLEDLVREMLKPMLKAWLDDNLPNMVERLVRAEIERVSRGRG